MMKKDQWVAQNSDFSFKNDTVKTHDGLFRPIEQDIRKSNNIMYDTRVARGNTYASSIVTESERRNQYVMQRNTYQRIARKRERQLKEEARQAFTGTPPPMEGRYHMDIQTESCWEELSDADRPDEAESGTQTNNISPTSRPLSPLFIPAKVGIDSSTQVDFLDDKN